jgi:hypothetical protein
VNLTWPTRSGKPAGFVGKGELGRDGMLGTHFRRAEARGSRSGRRSKGADRVRQVRGEVIATLALEKEKLFVRKSEKLIEEEGG